MAANIFEQLSEQLAVTSNNAHQTNLTFANATAKRQTESMVENPSNVFEALGNIPLAAATLRGSQPPIQTTI